MEKRDSPPARWKTVQGDLLLGSHNLQTKDGQKSLPSTPALLSLVPRQTREIFNLRNILLQDVENAVIFPPESGVGSCQF